MLCFVSRKDSIVDVIPHRESVLLEDIEIFKEIAKDSVLYFKKGNHEDLSKKIELLYSSKKIQQKLISLSQNNLKNFSRKSFIEGFEKIILKP